MAIVVWFASLLTVVLIKPLLVNNPADEHGMNPDFVFDPAGLDFIEYEETSLFRVIPMKHIVFYPLVVILGVIIIYQLRRLWREQQEIQEMFQEFSLDNTSVMEVDTFHKETNKTFLDLERKSRLAGHRFGKLEKRINNNAEFDKIKEDVDFVSSSWSDQYVTFRFLDIDVTGSDQTVVGYNFTDVNRVGEMFDMEIARLDAVLNDDLLSLTEISRKVQMLERYFEK